MSEPADTGAGAVRRLRLAPSAARVLYNVADAWAPAEEARPVRGSLDLVPYVERRLRDERERRALALLLAVLEWEPRLRLRSLRGFAWLGRAERQALLAGWEASTLAPRRRAAGWLRRLVEAGLADARAAAPTAPSRSAPSQSPDGR